MRIERGKNVYYVVIDLEWNQYHNPMWTPTSRTGVKMHEEIIQIGCVKTDHNMNPVDTFKMYVRLAGGRRLDRYVKKLTHITDSDIASGEDFVVACPEFIKWLDDVDAVFSWGADDRRVFLNNVAFHSLEAPACPWYDAQKIYAAQKPEHGSLGLKNIAQEEGLYVNLTLHDAMNDAILTAFCMKDLDIEKGIEEYSAPKKTQENANEPMPIHTSKTHRHQTQQAAWEEANNGLLHCPQCMQALEWSGDEKGTIEKWYKPATCKTHGEFILKGEFIGQKYTVLKLSFYKPTEDVLEMIEGKPDSPAKKRRRRRKKKVANKPETLAPEEMLARAIAFAAEKHKEQTRKGTSVPYIVHPMEAAAIAATMSDDACVIAAAVLHDVLEDCEGVTQDDIENAFGAHVADLVSAETCSASEDASWKERKQATLDQLVIADEEQLIVALSDKLSNIRAMKRDYDAIGNKLFERFSVTDKKMHAWYYRSLKDVLEPVSRFSAYTEFSKLVDSVFGRKRLPKNEEKQTN